MMSPQRNESNKSLNKLALTALFIAFTALWYTATTYERLRKRILREVVEYVNARTGGRRAQTTAFGKDR